MGGGNAAGTIARKAVIMNPAEDADRVGPLGVGQVQKADAGDQERGRGADEQPLGEEH